MDWSGSLRRITGWRPRSAWGQYSMRNDRADREELRLLHAWNPMADPIRHQFRRDIFQRAASLPMKPARLRRRGQAIMLWISSQPMSFAFWLMSTLSLVGAVVTAVIGWPIWGAARSDYAGVVLAAGSATAFGSIVFSVVSTPFSRASDVAPGYTAVVLGQKSPWLSGLGIIGVSGLLLMHASLDPTRSGAGAAVLVALSAITWSWTSARRALASADPLIIAQQAGKYYRKATMRAAKFARAGLAKGWPKEVRADPLAVDLLTRDHQRDIVAGLLRQLRAGVRSTAGHGRSTEAVLLLEALAQALTDYARSVDGEIGPPDGLLEIVLSAVDSVVDSSLKHDDNEAGNYALSQLVWLGAQNFGEPEYAAVRALVVRRLSSYLDDSWNNDTSTVPAGCVVSIGELIRKWVGIHAFEDVSRGLDILGQIAGRAVAARRKHIGYSATDQLAASFPLLCNQPHPGLRKHYLQAWSETAALLMRLAPLEPIDGMSGVVDALVPGVSLARGASLQRTMWEVAPSHASAAVDAILDALEPALQSLDSDTADDRTFQHGLTDGLALAYGTALLLAQHRELDSAQEHAARILNGVLIVTNSEAGTKALASGDVAELLWSILLSAAFIGVRDDQLRAAAEALLDGIGADSEWQPPPIDEAYLLAFVVGLKVLAGMSESEIETWEEGVLAAQRRDPFGASQWEWGWRIEGLGRAPSANRNHVAAPPAIFAAINDAAVERWPGLGSPGSAIGDH